MKKKVLIGVGILLVLLVAYYYKNEVLSFFSKSNKYAQTDPEVRVSEQVIQNESAVKSNNGTKNKCCE